MEARHRRQAGRWDKCKSRFIYIYIYIYIYWTCHNRRIRTNSYQICTKLIKFRTTIVKLRAHAGCVDVELIAFFGACSILGIQLRVQSITAHLLRSYLKYHLTNAYILLAHLGLLGSIHQDCSGKPNKVLIFSSILAESWSGTSSIGFGSPRRRICRCLRVRSISDGQFPAESGIWNPAAKKVKNVRASKTGNTFCFVLKMFDAV